MKMVLMWPWEEADTHLDAAESSYEFYCLFPPLHPERILSGHPMAQLSEELLCLLLSLHYDPMDLSATQPASYLFLYPQCSAFLHFPQNISLEF